jgi:citrate lyase subunit beta / citryl-CoA lyase
MIRLRRSVLYLPASNVRAIEKARTLASDGVILDLEDAVAPDAKAIARANAVEAVRAGGFGRREVIVRVNGLATPWYAQDIAAVREVRPDAVLLPKASSAADIIELANGLASTDGAFAQRKRPARPEPVEGRATVHASTGSARTVATAFVEPPFPAQEATQLWAMIETPVGVLNAAAIAAAHPRLTCLVMGTTDLLNDLRATALPGRANLVPALCHTLLAARAAGVDCLDGVHMDLADADGLAAACAQGRALGFDGKTLIHPSQIAVANEAFGVSAEAADHARAVIAAHLAAQASGQGVAVLNGKLIEALHVAAAERALALYQAQQSS